VYKITHTFKYLKHWKCLVQSLGLLDSDNGTILNFIQGKCYPSPPLRAKSIHLLLLLGVLLVQHRELHLYHFWSQYNFYIVFTELTEK
jgi:hypothetical protein